MLLYSGTIVWILVWIRRAAVRDATTQNHVLYEQLRFFYVLTLALCFTQTLLLCLGVHPKSVRPLRLTVSITHSWLTVGQRSVLSGLLAAFCGIYRRCSSSWTHGKHVCKSGPIPRSFSSSFTAVSAVPAVEIKSIQSHWHKISLYVVNILHSLLRRCPHSHARTHAHTQIPAKWILDF